MRGYIIDVNNDRCGKVTIKDGNHLKQYCELIGCEYIDIAVRRVGGKPYNIVLDDVGMLVQNPIVSAVDPQMRAMLAGTLILFGMDDCGELSDLTDKDVANIESNVYEVFDFDDMSTNPVLVLEY